MADRPAAGESSVPAAPRGAGEPSDLGGASIDPIRGRRRRRALGLAGAGAGTMATAGVVGVLLGAAPAAPSVERTAAGSATATTTVTVATATPREIRYGRDIRPLLSDRCFLCHGTDEATRAMGLRLDVRADAIADRGGFAAIVPGDAEASDLWQRITSGDPHEVMPPPEAGRRPFSDEELVLIRDWIDAGAPYESHWAFDPPSRPPVPQPAAAADGDPHAGFVRNPIDGFVLETMLAAGVTPSPPADPATLLRRVFLDLTGLPPTAEELDAFLADSAPGAYERWVDRLLTEDRFRHRMAERLAAPWLDAARFADTIGIHTDNGRQMWLYRDWVLEAFRDNMPYDRFLTEQLAGDLLPDATVAQRIASGFNRSHVITDEGGAIDEEYLLEYAVDRVDTTTAVFLGLTAGCARCHDHKYDPITQEDYFSLIAYFNSIEEPGLYSQDNTNPRRAFEPFLEVPTPAQQAELQRIEASLAALEAERTTLSPEEQAERTTFLAGTGEALGLQWLATEVRGAASLGGATLQVDATGTVVASGANPARDVHEITLSHGGEAADLLRLDVLPDPGRDAAAGRRVGRAANGNAVLTGVELEADLDGDGAVEPLPIRWACADSSQSNGDYHHLTAFDRVNPNAPGADRGWAVDGHNREGARALVMLLQTPLPAGTPATLRLRYESRWDLHTLAAVRPVLGRIGDAGAATLPVVWGPWHIAGPFTARTAEGLYDRLAPAESVTAIDRAAAWPPALDAAADADAEATLRWRHDPQIRDGVVVPLTGGVNVHVLARTVHAPAAMDLPVSVGSDDGFRLHVNGRLVHERRVARGVTPDQDRVRVPLEAGPNTVVFTVINTGGAAGMFFRPAEEDPAYTPWPTDLGLALLPAEVRAADAAFTERVESAWAVAVRPRQREILAELESARARQGQVLAAVPRTMVMKERAEPRPTYVLDRGMYDAQLMDRPVTRRPPLVLGEPPADAPADRLGLARWMTDPANPLVARVAVNRLWMTVMGSGLVRTPDDFGFQGEWPTHPELLDWLAVEFRESGWDMRHILRMIVTSGTYRQSSAIRPAVAALDPDDRLLARYPSRRLPAEMIRDQALAVSGLLVEDFGGPSVKPPQPEGLWREVAMLQSNTRIFEPGPDDERYRRSVYTYWKRASPPPSMVAFDAPTREACVIERSITNTPLQALVLWNDEQFVEAARGLAQRVLAERPGASDAERLAEIFRRCTAREPDAAERTALAAALEDFRGSFAARPDEAAAFVDIGPLPRPHNLDAAELAAWTTVASAVLNLHRTVTHP